jgi:filamentous hemagglutinin
MPASDDPSAEALKYAEKLYDLQIATPVNSGLEDRGGIVVRLPDGAYITYRPAGLGGKATLPTTATLDINDLNGGWPLKLKFPKK